MREDSAQPVAGYSIAANVIERRYLESWGEVEWSRLVDAAAGMTCAWADYRGFHIGTCPQEAPPYTHIWGWSADQQTLFRGRIDDRRVTVGWLRMAGASVELVYCVVRDVITWRPDHKRLQIEHDCVSYPHQMHAVEVIGPKPVAFISA